jgi:hypothetical protein
VIGKIVNVRDANMTLTLTITDGTGMLDVDHFLNDSDGGQVVSTSATISVCQHQFALWFSTLWFSILVQWIDKHHSISSSS